MKITGLRFLVLGALLGFVGCNSFNKSEVNPFDGSGNWVDPPAAEEAGEEIEYGLPTSVGMIWVDSVLTKPGAPPIRGFGGRLFFYNDEGESVRSNGKLTIYAFDDSSNGLSAKVPDRKFIFRQEEFQTHYTSSDLGPTYNFWIPWDRADGERKMIALLPIFETEDGRVIRGEQSLNVLPGDVPRADDLDPSARTNIEQIGRASTRIWRSTPSHVAGQYDSRLVSHQDSREAQQFDSQLNQTRIQTSTISLSPALANQMRHAQAYQQRQQQAFETAQARLTQQAATEQQANEPIPQITPLSSRGTGTPDSVVVGADGYRDPNNVLGPLDSVNEESSSGQAIQPTQRTFGQPGAIRPYRGN